MWRCNSFFNFPWMSHGYPYGFFHILIWIVMILAATYLVLRIIDAVKNGRSSQKRDQDDSIEILKIRYARGEISHEDYMKMKDTLMGS